MSFSSQSETFQSLPMDNFNNWIFCVCVVKFDLELGQTMECIYPKHTKISDSEKSNVNYLSFPDSNSGCMGDTRYHFRFRCKVTTKSHNCNEKYSDLYPDYLKPSLNHCYGFVNFRQIRDKSIRRGYFQKSVVILTQLPFTSLFYKIVEIVSQAYYDNGDVGLEVVCRDIDRWLPPLAGNLLNLPIAGLVIQTEIPLKTECIKSEIGNRIKITKSLIESIENDQSHMINNDLIHVLPYPHNQDCFSVFGSVLNQLQLLWELVLTNQSILVFSNSPTITSLVVQSLATSISPLQFSEEFRPFFTIHDSEFKEFTKQSQTPPQIILGITNPFFIKALSHWPNILKITDVKLARSKSKKVKNPSYLFTQDEIKPGLYSTYKSFLQTDKSLIKSLDKGIAIERPDSIQSEIIRKFYLELTQSFIIPLERYVASLMPLRRQIVPFKSPPSLKKFNIDEFLKALETSGPQLTSGIKGDWVGLYRSFYSCPNFVAWFSQRQQEINAKLVQIHIEVICQTDFSQWVLGKPEVELVDLIIQINTKLRECKHKGIHISAEHEAKLRDQIKLIMSSLDPDLQTMLRQSTTGTGAPQSP